MATIETRFTNAIQALRAHGTTVILNASEDTPTPHALDLTPKAFETTPYLFHTGEHGEADIQFRNGRPIHVAMDDCDCHDLGETCNDCATGTDRFTVEPLESLDFSYGGQGMAVADTAARVFEHYGFTVARPKTNADPLTVTFA